MDAAKFLHSSQADDRHPRANPFVIGVAQVERGLDTVAFEHRRIVRADVSHVGDGHACQGLFLIGRAGQVQHAVRLRRFLG